MTKLYLLIFLSLNPFLKIGPSDTLINNRWTVVSIKDNIINKTFSVNKNRATIFFNDTMYYVHSCNSFFGKYKLDDNSRINVLGLSQTLVNCSDIVDSYVEKYFYDLTYHIALDTLTLSNNKGVTFKCVIDK